MTSQITTIDTNEANFAAMAKTMGIAVSEGDSSKKETSTLPRFRIWHQPIMGVADVKGKKKKVEVLEGGTFRLEVPNGETIYSPTASIRVFMQRYMYKRFVANPNAKEGESRGTYHKTVMADNLNIDLKDNQGTFNCGKPAGYIADFKALPESMQDLIRQIKRVRVLFGEVTLDNPHDHNGDPLDHSSIHPFIWEIDNRDAFKTLGVPLTKMGNMKRLPLQHYITLTTKEQSLPNGNSFFLPEASLDLSFSEDISDSDQETFADFLAWVTNYNEYIMSQWELNVGQEDVSGEEAIVINDIIDTLEIEEAVA